MKALFYISIVFAFLLLSCTKFGRNVTIKGKAFNPITGTTYSDLKVQLIKSESLSLPGGYKEIKHTYTDDEGNFEINASRMGKIWVQIQSGSDLYVLGWYQQGEYISDNFRVTAQKRETMEADFHVVPYGKYQLVINNINCQGINDTIIINQTNQVGSFLGEDWVLTGCSGYTTALDETPTGNIHTEYTVIRSGISNSYEVDFNVHPNQNNQQIINY